MNISAICGSDPQALNVCKQHYDALDEDKTECSSESLNLDDDKGESVLESRTVAVCVFENDDKYAVSYGSSNHLIWYESGDVFYASRNA
ncbi:hypothetical protein U1Q18_051051 [Sarracenia purpurea var. burkii]